MIDSFINNAVEGLAGIFVVVMVARMFIPAIARDIKAIFRSFKS